MIVTHILRLLIGKQCSITHLRLQSHCYFGVDAQIESWCFRLYFCYVPYSLSIKSHSALSAFLIYLKMQGV